MLDKKHTSVATLVLLLALAATPKPLAALLEPEPVRAQAPTAPPNTEPSPAAGSNADSGTSVASKGGIPLWVWLLPIAILGLLVWWLLQNRQTQPDRTPQSDRSTSDSEEESSPNRISAYRDRINPSPTPDVTPTPEVSDPVPEVTDQLPEISAQAPEVSAQAPEVSDQVPEVSDPVPEISAQTDDTSQTEQPALPISTDLEVPSEQIEISSARDEHEQPASESTIVLTPRSLQEAHAHWDVSEQHKVALRQRGGTRLALRICDVTGIDPNTQQTHGYQHYECDELEQERYVSVPVRDRDYIAELGYTTSEEGWLLLARSTPVRIAPTHSEEVLSQSESVTVAEPAAELSFADQQEQPKSENIISDRQEQPKSESTIVLTPRSFQDVYVHWDVSEQDKAALRQQGGTRLALRICDITGIDPNTQPAHNCQHYECDEQERDRYLTIAVRDRNYMAEIGYTTPTGGWLLLARSAPVRIPPGISLEDLMPTSSPALAEQAAPSTGTEVTAEPLVTDEQEPPESESTIVLSPRNFQEAYVHWNVSEQHKAALRQQGGTRLALRICDVTGIDPNTQQTHGCQHYECDEFERDRYLTIAVRDRDYMAEIGYTTATGGWLLLARSAPVRIPPVNVEAALPS
jgi:hypothetical protein